MPPLIPEMTEQASYKFEWRCLHDGEVADWRNSDYPTQKPRIQGKPTEDEVVRITRGANVVGVSTHVLPLRLGPDDSIVTETRFYPVADVRILARVKRQRLGSATITLSPGMARWWRRLLRVPGHLLCLALRPVAWLWRERLWVAYVVTLPLLGAMVGLALLTEIWPEWWAAL